MEKFSPTKLDTYRHCPRQYKFKYVDRLKSDRSGVEAVLGVCVHTAFEALYEARSHGKLLSEEETLEVFRKEWREKTAEPPTFRDARFTLADWKRIGEECVSGYWRGHQPFDEDKTVAVERRIGFALAVKDPVSGERVDCRIEGFMDRLSLAKDGFFEIHDYKTGGSLPTQAQKDEDWQLALYDVGVREAWPDAPGVRLVWHYVRHGKSIVSTRTPEQLEALKSEVADLIGKIEEEVARKDDPAAFKPERSPLCDWCDFRDLCPLFKHAEDLAKLPPDEQILEPGAKLVNQYAEVEAEKKKLREQLGELETKEEDIAQRLIAYARSKSIQAVAGADYEAEVHAKEDLRFPTKTKEPEKVDQMEGELKELPALWKAVSRLDTRELLDLYKKRRLPEAVFETVKAWLDKWGRPERKETVRLRKRREAKDE